MIRLIHTIVKDARAVRNLMSAVCVSVGFIHMPCFQYVDLTLTRAVYGLGQICSWTHQGSISIQRSVEVWRPRRQGVV